MDGTTEQLLHGALCCCYLQRKPISKELVSGTLSRSGYNSTRGIQGTKNTCEVLGGNKSPESNNDNNNRAQAHGKWTGTRKETQVGQ